MKTEETTFPLYQRKLPLSGLNRITNGLYLSNAKAASKQSLLSKHHITCVINVTTEMTENGSSSLLEYIHIPVLDNPDTCLLTHFEDIAKKIHDIEVNGGHTLLHCVAGVSRSPTLCLAYLMKYHDLSLLAAHDWLKTCRPIIRPNIGFWKQLISYEMTLYGKATVSIIDSPIGAIPSVYEKEIKNVVPI